MRYSANNPNAVRPGKPMRGMGGRPSPEMTGGPGAFPPMSTDGGMGNMLDRMQGMGGGPPAGDMGGMGNVLDRTKGMVRGQAMGGRPSPEMTGGPGAPPPMGGMGGRPSPEMIGAPPPMGGMGNQQMGGMGTPPIGAPNPAMMKKGGAVKAKAFAKGGSVSKVSSASSRADGCATKGKTKGRFV